MKNYQDLTQKEIEICVSFLKNKSDFKKIAEEKRISLTTVKTHINSIYLKLLINNKSELTHMLLTTNIIPEGLKKYTWLKDAKNDFKEISLSILKACHNWLKLDVY